MKFKCHWTSADEKHCKAHKELLPITTSHLSQVDLWLSALNPTLWHLKGETRKAFSVQSHKMTVISPGMCDRDDNSTGSWNSEKKKNFLGTSYSSPGYKMTTWLRPWVTSLTSYQWRDKDSDSHVTVINQYPPPPHSRNKFELRAQPVGGPQDHQMGKFSRQIHQQQRWTVASHWRCGRGISINSEHQMICFTESPKKSSLKLFGRGKALSKEVTWAWISSPWKCSAVSVFYISLWQRSPKSWKVT